MTPSPEPARRSLFEATRPALQETNIGAQARRHKVRHSTRSAYPATRRALLQKGAAELRAVYEEEEVGGTSGSLGGAGVGVGGAAELPWPCPSAFMTRK